MPALIYQLDELNWTKQLHEKSNDKFLKSSTLLRILLYSTNNSATNSRHCSTDRSISTTTENNFEFDAYLNDQIPIKDLNSRIPFDNFRRIKWKWSSSQARNHVYAEANKVVIHPYCNKNACFETYAAIGDRPLKRNAFTYWEVKILNRSNQLSRATSIMIGLGNNQAKLNTIGYLNLLGIDQNSLGLSNSGHVWFNSQPKLYTSSNPFTETDPESTCTIIGCLYDGYRNQLTFYKDGQYLNFASIDLDSNNLNGDLFPMVSSTMSNTQFKFEMVFESQQNLQELCKSTIRNFLTRSNKLTLGNENNILIDKQITSESLKLPISMINFLKR